jgi:hypothetical protein
MIITTASTAPGASSIKLHILHFSSMSLLSRPFYFSLFSADMTCRTLVTCTPGQELGF